MAMKVTDGIVELTRDFAHPVEAVFAAWSSRSAQESWGDPGDGWAMAFDRFAFAVGESDLCRFGPVGGHEYLNENRYMEIERDRRIVYSTSLRSGGHLTFAGTVAVTFDVEGAGTRMRLVENGLYLDGRDDVAGHRAGWEAMLDALGVFLDRPRR